MFYEAERYYPEYFFTLTNEGCASNRLQTDFKGPGSFFNDEFEIQVPQGYNGRFSPTFTLYNYNTEDDEDYSYFHEEPFDVIRVNEGKITSITPFKSDEIYENGFYEYRFVVDNILWVAVDTINKFSRSKLREIIDKSKNESKVRTLKPDNK